MIQARTKRATPVLLALSLAFWGGAIPAPPFACAHSSDTTLARVRLGQGREVSVEVTVDLHQNPHLQGVDNIALLLGQTLRVHLPSGKNWALGDLGKPVFSFSSGYESPSPVPLGHNGLEQSPELTTLTWTWRPSESPIRVSVAPQSPQTVLFWSVGPADEQPHPGWRILLGGNSTPPITLPHPPSRLNWNWKSITALSFAAAGLLLQGALLVRRLRTRATP